MSVVVHPILFLCVLACVYEVISVLVWTVQVIYNYPTIKNQIRVPALKPDYNRVRAGGRSSSFAIASKVSFLFPPKIQKKTAQRQ
jgi:hypothetical protein